MPKMDIEKTIYFVRHGESEDNAKPVYQSPSSPLSEIGKEQALKIADRASKLSFQTLISSTYTRARETAEIIGKITNKESEYSELFVERIKPSRLNGKLHDDPALKDLWNKWEESLFNGDLRVEDGENYTDIISRADKALGFLANRSEKQLLVISHGFFLRVLISRVILGNSMSEENLRNFQSAASMKNTGLSALHYCRWHEEDTSKWRLWIYNDHSHLG